MDVFNWSDFEPTPHILIFVDFLFDHW